MSVKSHVLESSWVDPDDAPELTEEWLAKARPMLGGKTVSLQEVKAAFAAMLNSDRPNSESDKVPLWVPYSQEVVKYFLASGEGWQNRMDEALKEWIEAHT